MMVLRDGLVTGEGVGSYKEGTESDSGACGGSVSVRKGVRVE